MKRELIIRSTLRFGAAISLLALATNSLADIKSLNSYSTGHVLTGARANPNVIISNSNDAYLQAEITDNDHKVIVKPTSDPSKNGALLEDALTKLKNDPTITEISLGAGTYDFDSSDYKFVLPRGDSINGAGQGNTIIKIESGPQENISFQPNSQMSGLTLTTPGMATLTLGNSSNDTSVTYTVKDVALEVGNVDVTGEASSTETVNLNATGSLAKRSPQADLSTPFFRQRLPDNVHLAFHFKDGTFDSTTLLGIVKFAMKEIFTHPGKLLTSSNSGYPVTVESTGGDIVTNSETNWICTGVNIVQNAFSFLVQQKGTMCGSGFLDIQSNLLSEKYANPNNIPESLLRHLNLTKQKEKK